MINFSQIICQYVKGIGAITASYIFSILELFPERQSQRSGSNSAARGSRSRGERSPSPICPRIRLSIEVVEALCIRSSFIGC